MKQALTIKQVMKKKMTWGDVFKYYKPEITQEEVDFLLWEKTCFPFDSETTLKMIHSLFNESSKK